VLGEEGGKTGNFKACSGILPVKESKNATILSTSSFVKGGCQLFRFMIV